MNGVDVKAAACRHNDPSKNVIQNFKVDIRDWKEMNENRRNYLWNCVIKVGAYHFD